MLDKTLKQPFVATGTTKPSHNRHTWHKGLATKFKDYSEAQKGSGNSAEMSRPKYNTLTALDRRSLPQMSTDTIRLRVRSPHLGARDGSSPFPRSGSVGDELCCGASSRRVSMPLSSNLRRHISRLSVESEDSFQDEEESIKRNNTFPSLFTFGSDDTSDKGDDVTSTISVSEITSMISDLDGMSISSDELVASESQDTKL